MKPLVSVSSLILTAFLAASGRGQEDYQGAEAVLRRMEAQASDGPLNRAAGLRAGIQDLRKTAAALPPEEAADRWLALLDAWLSATPRQREEEEGGRENGDSAAKVVELPDVLSALPPSAAWDVLERRLAEKKPSNPRHAAFMELLVSVLRGDKPAWKLAFDHMIQAAEASGSDTRRAVDAARIRTLQVQLDFLTAFGDDLFVRFESYVADREGDNTAETQPDESNAIDVLIHRYQPFVQRVEIPDLVRVAGEERASALLARAMRVGLGTLDVQGTATKRLAAKVALAEIDHLPAPTWGLVETLEDAPLYPALMRKFPKGESYREYDRARASTVYLASLITNGRTEEAWRFFQEESQGRSGPDLFVLTYAVDPKTAGRMLAFFRLSLTQGPETPGWSGFIELSARLKDSAGALALAGEVITRQGLDPGAAVVILPELTNALFAADHHEEGVLLLRELVRAGSSGNSGGSREPQAIPLPGEGGKHITPEALRRWSPALRQNWLKNPEEYPALCGRLAEVGRLLNHPEWTAEALQNAAAWLESLPAESRSRSLILETFAELAARHQQGVLAERLILSRLNHPAGLKPDEETTDEDDVREEREKLIESLAKLYARVGRHWDVLLLLERSPHWEENDLTDLDSALWLPAAEALAGTGKREEARRIIRRYLQDSPQDDRGYELWLRLGASEGEIMAFLDTLAAANRFEERPLIWKARLLLDHGRIEEAEKAARAAIGIDPSDGEQGKGDRMRAYAVLAEALEKKGDAATAAVMRGAVSAIRKSDDADDWWEAGFLSEAVRRYEAALADFADAYCIQSRLALRYSEQGNDAKAEEHYVRAFELMPDSFGRVESHCFGCEGAFTGAQAQNAAERVLTRLAATPPVKAQVHYLLGYLRETQGRTAEAAEAWRLAVKTDPDYLNAWRKLEGLGERGAVPLEDLEEATFSLLRLEPVNVSTRAASVRNLRRLWDMVPVWERAAAWKEKGPLLALPAAVAEKKGLQGKNPENRSFRIRKRESGGDMAREVWSDNYVMQLIIRYLESVGNP